MAFGIGVGGVRGWVYCLVAAGVSGGVHALGVVMRLGKVGIKVS